MPTESFDVELVAVESVMMRFKLINRLYRPSNDDGKNIPPHGITKEYCRGDVTSVPVDTSRHCTAIQCCMYFGHGFFSPVRVAVAFVSSFDFVTNADDDSSDDVGKSKLFPDFWPQ